MFDALQHYLLFTLYASQLSNKPATQHQQLVQQRCNMRILRSHLAEAIGMVLMEACKFCVPALVAGCGSVRSHVALCTFMIQAISGQLHLCVPVWWACRLVRYVAHICPSHPKTKAPQHFIISFSALSWTQGLYDQLSAHISICSKAVSLVL